MKTILVVDDSATMRRMIMASLRALGEVRFDEARSGLEAIERLSLAPVDLITLDLNMPDMHGLDVLRFVRGQAAYQSLPIVVLTTRGDPSVQGETLGAGASLCLSKPFAPDALAQQVGDLLHTR